jgi:phenylacetate-coenzyme A ligase PaaK-like adenylate-forming protein
VSGRSTCDFEADRQRHLQAFAAGLGGEAERLTWPLERLHGLRDARLRALLRTAVTRSPWHRRRLAGIDPDAVTGADLALLPRMTKADVMEHWDEIVTDRRLSLGLAEGHLDRVVAEGPAYLFGEFQVVTTGGSSGSRGVFVWDFGGWLSFGLSRDRTTLGSQNMQAAARTCAARSSPPRMRRIRRRS